MNLHHRILGEGQNLVVLHGLFGSSDNWQTHAKKLSEYYKVISVDLRNHGHSPWSDEMSYELMASDLKQLIDDLKLESIHLLGHSMGGKVAMVFANLYPDILEKLIIVDIGIKQYPSHHDEILAGLEAIDLSIIDSRSEAESQLSKYVPNEGTKQFLLKNLYWKNKDQLAWRMNIPVLKSKMDNILEALNLQEIFIPTLFVKGAESAYIVEQDIETLEKKFIDFNLATIENAGHWVHAENPEKFIESILGFLLR